MTSSTVYTIGTALNRAFDNRLGVSLLVNGQWLQGEVAALDGYGVVLDRLGTDHYVVKLDDISVIHVMSAAPMTRAADPADSRAHSAHPHLEPLSA